MMKEVDRRYRQIFWSEEVGGLWKMKMDNNNPLTAGACCILRPVHGSSTGRCGRRVVYTDRRTNPIILTKIAI